MAKRKRDFPFQTPVILAGPLSHVRGLITVELKPFWTISYGPLRLAPETLGLIALIDVRYELPRLPCLPTLTRFSNRII